MMVVASMLGFFSSLFGEDFFSSLIREEVSLDWADTTDAGCLRRFAAGDLSVEKEIYLV